MIIIRPFIIVPLEPKQLLKTATPSSYLEKRKINYYRCFVFYKVPPALALFIFLIWIVLYSLKSTVNLKSVRVIWIVLWIVTQKLKLPRFEFQVSARFHTNLSPKYWYQSLDLKINLKFWSWRDPICIHHWKAKVFEF